MSPEVTLREATPPDADDIVRLIRELARFERLEGEVKARPRDIIRDGFGPDRRFECLLAEVAGEVIGFALFFHNYSTFEGRAGLYLEDIYVSEAHRGRGIGTALIGRLASIAREKGFARLDLSVLDWNPATSFYKRLGFVEMSDWRPYRLKGEALDQLAGEDDVRK